jgi:predicted NUDIX family NTP pyrophosphohydrolase
MYRVRGDTIEVLLAHPGGPYFVRKDHGYWTIPKGEYDDNEDALAAAQREFNEETGLQAVGPFIDLGEIKQKGGKYVRAWGFKADCDPATLVSNTFEMEWPPKSGQYRTFPEVDRCEFFTLDDARRRIKETQVPLIDALDAALNA